MHHWHHYTSLKDASEIFYNFAVGIGALGGLFAVYKLFDEWRNEKVKREKIEQLRKIYPASELGHGYKIADSVEDRGVIYIIDLRNSKKHWIQSSSTFVDLGFDWRKVEHITADEFRVYHEGDPILTSGTPGS
jgi:hypothetical protein